MGFLEQTKNHEMHKKVGKELSFVTREAYKQIRANISFLLDDLNECKVVTITSSVPAEGKSLTTMNLAISFSEIRKKILIIEGDMRKPSIEKYFRVRNNKGLSDILNDKVQWEDVLQKSNAYEDLYMISAGTIPDNPVECLCSTNMKKLLIECRSKFDLIILDVPPIAFLSDSLILSKFTDGFVLVVREKLVEKQELEDAISQLQLANAKILGVIYNGQSIASSKFYKKRYYKKFNPKSNRKF